MSEKNELEQAFIFGQEAEKVTKNKAYQFAMTSISGEIFSRLETVDISSDNGAVLELVRELQVTAKFKEKLEMIMSEGKFAEAQIKDHTENPQRYK